MDSGMSKLSTKAHWDFVHGARQPQILRPDVTNPQNPPLSWSKRGTRALKRVLGPSILSRATSYSEYLLWEQMFPEFLHPKEGAKIVEIGSAPGDFLVKFSRKYGSVPYGIEYSDTGAQVNRETFRRHGFNPDHVIHGDFFSDELIDRFRGKFDIVFSRGFIEHFTDVKAVIDRHVDLLAPGGHLFVDVPNFRGVNYPLAQLFDKEAIPRHNIEIMHPDVFSGLFKRDDLQSVACGYYGTFSFYLFSSDTSPVSRGLLRASFKVQLLLNLAFRTFLGKRRLESPMFSPFLNYIGRKVEVDSNV
jgi:SAM-dependent methyltransferase